MAALGYLRFATTPVLREYSNPIIDGEAIDGQMRAFSEGFQAPGARLEALDQSHILQWRFLANYAPVSVAAFAIPFSMLVRKEEQFNRLAAICRSGRPVSFFCGWPHWETWLLPVNPTGTLWRSSRRTAWNGTTITHATHPPQALVDGVAQTIVTTGTPAAGEVKILTAQSSSIGYFEVTTPNLTGSAVLEVLYWPEYFVRFEEPRFDVLATNNMMIHATLREMRPALPLV